MATLSEVQRQADLLSPEERDGLLSYLLHHREGAPTGIDDDEVLRREEAMDSGEEQTLSKQEFLKQVGRGLP